MTQGKTTEIYIAENKAKIDSSYNEIREIYIYYRDVIRPFVAFLELFDAEFPVEILNEIRAIFQHIARCYYSEKNTSTNDDIDKNLRKANSHINRALLDCFKYSCLTLYDEYKSFVHLYRHVDLSSLDNGEFLKNLHCYKEAAKKADRKARSLEGETGDEDAVFEEYEAAFNASVVLHNYILKHAPYAARLKHKFRIGTFFSVLGWIVGFVSGVYSLWVAFGDKIIQLFS